MQTKTILLVEDNTSDVALTKRALSKNHIMNNLVVVGDGELALDYLFCNGNYADRDKRDMPALILLDLNLPKIDGLSVLKQIRENPKTKLLPIVILTSSKEDIDLATAYDNGANSYIRKPVDFNQFSEAIKCLGLYWLVINEAPPVL